MAVPELTRSGDLPVGVHPATLAELVARFGSGSDRRKLLALRLERVYEIAKQTGHLLHFVVFGSFVTDKELPNDVDVFIIMDDNFEFGRLEPASRLLFDHAAAQDHFGCSIFWVRSMAAMGGAKAAMADWQIKRDGSERGIVEIIGEGP